MPLVCPRCGSRHLRYAHRHSLSEHLWSWVGVRPLRCRDCRLRFVERTWRLGSMRFARCPKCWRMDLNIWSLEDFPSTARQRLLMRLGASRYRCEYCRVNFVSFRPRLEKYTSKRWTKRRKAKDAARAGNREGAEASSGGGLSPGSADS